MAEEEKKESFDDMAMAHLRLSQSLASLRTSSRAFSETEDALVELSRKIKQKAMWA